VYLFLVDQTGNKISRDSDQISNILAFWNDSPLLPITASSDCFYTTFTPNYTGPGTIRITNSGENKKFQVNVISEKRILIKLINEASAPTQFLQSALLPRLQQEGVITTLLESCDDESNSNSPSPDLILAFHESFEAALFDDCIKMIEHNLSSKCDSIILIKVAPRRHMKPHFWKECHPLNLKSGIHLYSSNRSDVFWFATNEGVLDYEKYATDIEVELQSLAKTIANHF